ncbi:INO80 complex subunit D-like protein [Perilla frutescens var. hirtella]|uniref:INO80 complex subunit D-like protein n=1 Tax=Perilla frutescens var. hirtella TaxID=608512 RepID=A0AAD4IV20_PERFH|nr:INO80 complex subunit D-like protein [Perilla frutescens var. hirtella]
MDVGCKIAFIFCAVYPCSTTGPILCGKPILRSTVPSYCPAHFQKAERHMVRALKKSGLNIASTSKLAPKLHVIVAEYVRQIQQKRRSAKRTNLENAEIKEEKNT